MTRRDVATLMNTAKAELRSKGWYVCLGLLLALLAVGGGHFYRARSLERCLGRHLRERAGSQLEVVHFGAAQVAAHVGEPLGEQLWACSQVFHRLRAAAAADATTACQGRGGGGGGGDDGGGAHDGDEDGGSGRCAAFLEFFGPGLCAFDVAVQLPYTAVGLLTSTRRLANVSAALTGVRDNVRMLEVGGRSAAADSADGDGAASDDGGGGGGGLEAELAKMLPAVTPPESPYIVVQVNLHHADSDDEDDAATLESLRKLLEQGSIHEAVLMLPTGAAAGSEEATEEATLRQRAAALVGAAAAADLHAFWGGFDGAPVTEQELRDGTWPPPPPQASATAAASPPPRRTAVASLFISRRRAPPPAVHVLAPLRAADPQVRAELVGQLCHYLLDTAAASNLSVHVAGLTLTGAEFDHKMVKSQKLPVLLHALAAPSVAPSDVVLVVDATDTLAQVSTEALLAQYFERGAPVMAVATEINCWPPQFVPWCRFYEGADKPPLAAAPAATATAATTTSAAVTAASARRLVQDGEGEAVVEEEEARQAEGTKRQQMRQGQQRQPVPNRFINSGGFMGRAVIVEKYLRDIVELLRGPTATSNWLPGSCSCLEPDDQALLACAYLFDDNPYGITMDFRTDFFYSAFLATHYLAPSAVSKGGKDVGGGDGDVGGGNSGGGGGMRWVNSLTAAMPAIVHGNGWDGKERLEVLRGLILGSGLKGEGAGARRADPGFEFWLDGQRTRYEELCPA